MTRTARTTDNLDLNIAAFSRHLEAEGKSGNTISAYRKATDQLSAFLRANDLPVAVRAITAEHIERFLIDLQQRGMAPATVNQRYRSLQQFWKYLEAEGEVRITPLRNIRPPRIPEDQPATVTEAMMRALLRTCAGTTFTDRRDTALLSLLYDTGCRRAELAGLAVADIDQTTKTAKVVGKGSRVRFVRYGRETNRDIDRYLRRRSEHPDRDLPAFWLGQRGALSIYGIEQIVQRRAHEAGLDISPHAFRRGWANEMLRSGAQEGDVALLAGWRSRQMIDRYTRSVASERARTNYDQHSPMDRLRR